MIFVVVLLAVTVIALDLHYSPHLMVRRDHFEVFKSQFGKSYHNEIEHSKRFDIFSFNLKRIHEHNLRNASFTMKMNKFGDLLPEEFSKLNKGLVKSNEKHYKQVHNTSTKAVPASIDWTTKGAVTAVKNQGSCGSCWAFSTTGAIEGLFAIKKGKLQSLSEQQLIDCSSKSGNAGCDGGDMDAAFQWTERNGICAENEYQYDMVQHKCHVCNSIGKIRGFRDVLSNDEDALKSAVAQQPVAVAIEADQDLFQFYHEGVLRGDCGTELDHGVLLVGYGSENGVDFWKIKNSWGADWGEDGFIRIERRGGKANGMCGIAMDASYPVL